MYIAGDIVNVLNIVNVQTYFIYLRYIAIFLLADQLKLRRVKVWLQLIGHSWKLYCFFLSKLSQLWTILAFETRRILSPVNVTFCRFPPSKNDSQHLIGHLGVFVCSLCTGVNFHCNSGLLITSQVAERNLHIVITVCGLRILRAIIVKYSLPSHVLYSSSGVGITSAGTASSC